MGKKTRIEEGSRAHKSLAASDRGWRADLVSLAETPPRFKVGATIRVKPFLCSDHSGPASNFESCLATRYRDYRVPGNSGDWPIEKSGVAGSRARSIASTRWQHKISFICSSCTQATFPRSPARLDLALPFGHPQSTHVTLCLL